MKKKIIAAALTTVILALTSQTAFIYADNMENTENSDINSSMEDIEEDNFVYDILDEMLEETETIETENNIIHWSLPDLFGSNFLWGNDEKNQGHYSSSETAGNSVGLDKETIEKLRIAATMPDKFGQAPTKEKPNKFYNKDKVADAYHGRGNYVANISYMWDLAQELGKNGDKKSALANVKSRTTARYQSKLTAKDWEILQELMSKMDLVLSTNMFPGTESDKKSRKYKILGTAMHMAGDTCAHRTIVPKDSINNFSSSYFDEGTKTVNVNDLKLWMKKGRETDYKNKIKAAANWAVFQQGVKTGCMEFRDIKYFANKNNIENIIKKYEDKASFYSIRYTITKNACIRLLKAKSLSDSRKIMVPRTHYFIFNNLKEYYIAAGGSKSDFNYWDKISTTEFV